MRTKSHWMVLTIALCMALVVIGPGCKHKKDTGVNVTTPKTSGSGTGQTDVSGLKFNPSDKLGKVYFDFDKSTLTADAMATLKKNAEIIKAESKGAQIQIAGHCDERGTQEYNLALGERRALAVRDYLISLGTPAGQLTTISYGEEQPAAQGKDEAAYSKNRRAEFNEAK